MRAAEQHRLQQLMHEQRLDEAKTLCLELCRQRSDDVDAWYAMGLIDAQRGAHDEAARCFQQVIQLAPQEAGAYFNIARIHALRGQWTEAANLYRKAIAVKPDFAAAHNNLGNLLLEQAGPQAALPHLREARRLQPKSAEYLNNMGNALKMAGRFGEAVAYLRAAVDADPTFAIAYNSLGTALQELGYVEEARACYLRALALKPDFAAAHSDLLFTLAYNVLCPPAEMLREHREWDRRHGAEGRAQVFSHAQDGDPERRLRIGYVSPDLRRHAVAAFFEPLLTAHDRARVEVFCYAEVARPDSVTQRLQALADHWYSSVGRSDAELARRIHDDRIDILIDLAGHTRANRLKAFTYKPAPVQVTYLGYCTTTGLSALDYWITDGVLHPEDTVEQAVEDIYRLDRCWLCYRPDPQAPPVEPPSPEAPLTFGSLNDLSKVTARVIAVWARVLAAVPGSRLLLKTRQLADAAIARQVTERFAAHGIAPERLTLLPATQAYLETYHAIDIALDTFPRTGGATTADALWMGVPVITLAGARFIERQGASMLTALALPELIATSEEDYLATAVALAQDHGRRTALRAGLRERMAASPLCDGPGLARALEQAYREMWRRFLAEAPA